MGATATLMTVQEFLQLPEQEGVRQELIGGEVVSMSYGKVRHEVTKKNLNKILVGWLLQHPLAELFVETGFQLDEHNGLIPDLSVVFPGRIQPESEGVPQGAPEVAIEVVSSESAARLEDKIERYLAHGAKSVWTVFPQQKVVRIFDASGGSTKFEPGQTLEDSAVLPGFSVPVAAIFEGL
jgi:Uma2 family endonuclease